jgi:hypothetical protein
MRYSLFPLQNFQRREGADARRGSSPDFVPAVTAAVVIDFFPVGRKIVHPLVAFIGPKLKRRAPGSKNQKRLRDALRWGDEGNRMAVGRKPHVVTRPLSNGRCQRFIDSPMATS